VSEDRKLSPLETVRREIDSHDGVVGKTVKIDIGSHDMYVKTGWFEGRLIRIDATVTPGPSEPVNELQPLEASRYDIVRMWIESECQLASDLLATGEVEVEYLIEWWKGRRGYPKGYSQKMSFENDAGIVQPMPVAGPFDAMSKLFEARIGEWRNEMLTHVEPVDTLVKQDTAEDGGGGQDERATGNGISDRAGDDGDDGAGGEGE